MHGIIWLLHHLVKMVSEIVSKKGKPAVLQKVVKNCPLRWPHTVTDPEDSCTMPMLFSKHFTMLRPVAQWVSHFFWPISLECNANSQKSNYEHLVSYNVNLWNLVLILNKKCLTLSSFSIGKTVLGQKKLRPIIPRNIVSHFK